MLKIHVFCELLSRLFFGLFGDVRIDIHRGLNVSMAETILHFLDRCARFEEQAAMRMPEAVNGYSGQAILFNHSIEFLIRLSGDHELIFCVRKDKLLFIHRIKAKLQEVHCLPFSPR